LAKNAPLLPDLPTMSFGVHL